MNAFTLAGTVLLGLFLPLGATTLFRKPVDGLVALVLCSAILVVTLLCLAEGFHRSTYYGLAVVAAVSGWIGGLVYARILGRYV